MKSIRTVAVSAISVPILFAATEACQAQPASIQQLQLNQQNTLQQMPLPSLRPGTNAPELYEGENADIGPQRILRLNPRPTYFDGLLDSEVYYSDNANFNPTPNRIQSFIYVNTVQAAFTPPTLDLGPGKLSADLGFSSQWYNYDNIHLSGLDFDAQTAFIGGKYLAGKWMATLNLNYTRLLDQEYYNETYREFLPSLSIQRFFTINDSLLLAIGDQVDYHATKVPVSDFITPPVVIRQPATLNDHFDNIIFATLNWQVTGHFAVQPFYRFQYSFYRRDAENASYRDDYLNSLGITAVYTFNSFISARVFVNYNNLLSDDAGTPEYGELNGGIGGSLNVKF